MEIKVKNANLIINKPETVVVVPMYDGWQGASNNMNNYPKGKHTVIPISEGDEVFLDGLGGRVFSFMSDTTEQYDAKKSTFSYSFKYANIGKREVVAGTAAIVRTAPAGAHSMWIGCYNSGATPPVLCCPAYIVVNGTTRYIVDGYPENVV